MEGTYGTSIFKRIKRESESLHSMMCNRYIEVWEYAVGAHVEQSSVPITGGIPLQWDRVALETVRQKRNNIKGTTLKSHIGKNGAMGIS